MPSLSSPLLSLLCPHRRAEKQKWLLQWESNTAVNTGTQSQWAIKCRPQSVHKQRGRSSHRKQRPCSSWRKITWWKKTGDNHAVTIVPQNRILFLFSLSLSLSSAPSHTLTHSRWSIGHQLRTGGVGVSRQQTTRTMGNQFGFLFMERKHYRLSSMIVAFCTVITCVFLYSKYTLAYSTWNWCSASLYCSKVIKPQTFQDQFKENKINETTRVMDLGV